MATLHLGHHHESAERSWNVGLHPMFWVIVMAVLGAICLTILAQLFS